MQLLKLQILMCLVTCCLWTHPKPGSAQDMPFSTSSFNFDAPVSVTDNSNSTAGPTTKPTAVDSPTDLPNQQVIGDGSPESPIYACACGCGIFEVGTETMLPSGTGLTVYIEYAYQDQNIDWSGVKPAPASANSDKEIRTNFYTPGFQYMFSRSWGVQAELPVDNRYFKTTGNAPPGTELVALDWTTIGDLRLEGIYTGFFPDMSAGVTFGGKFPTGSFQHNDGFDDIDRDSEIGTGSTDVLLGGFYRHNLTPDGTLTWFAQVNLDVPVLTQDKYTPGVECDSALGMYLNGLRVGNVAITPIAQVLNGLRGHDSGQNAANPVASGYERVLLSPGIEFDLHPIMIYADVELPVYAHVTGDQLVGADLFKMILSYHF
jgi:hypothetical protein